MLEANISPARFQILALDGGGIKGLFSAAVLAAIERDLNTNITDHFDLIAGTSTGGIIALALGLGMRPEEIVNFYLEEGPRIFPTWSGIKLMQHWITRKFSNAPLADALKRYFKDSKLGASKKRLIIPSFNLTDNDVYLFRTPHHAALKSDYKLPAWHVGMATSAAPTFFPSFREVSRLRLIDGGVWANNPALIGIVEAHTRLSTPLSHVRVLSVGTSDAVPGRRSRLDDGGKLAWAWGNAAIEVILRGQRLGVTNQSRLLVGKENFARLNPVVAEGEFSLDGIDGSGDLIGKAAHHTRHFYSEFERRFQDHRAGPYTPLYT